MFPKALRRDILAVLAVKAILLTLLYFAFFANHPPAFTGQQMRAHVLGDG